MYKKKKILAVILARSGSKGVKNKNVTLINGIPLISYTLIEALKSKYIDDIAVSTDSKEYLKIVKKYKVETPYLRPEKLSGDKVSSAACILDIFKFYENYKNTKYDYCIELMCTNPFKTSDDIDNILVKHITKKVDSVIAVTKLEDHHPRRIKKIVNGYIRDFCLKEKAESRRQDLKPEAYIRNGSIYSLTRKMVFKERRYGTKKSLAYVMPRQRVINIDEPQDLLIAKLMAKKLKGKIFKKKI